MTKHRNPASTTQRERASNPSASEIASHKNPRRGAHRSRMPARLVGGLAQIRPRIPLILLTLLSLVLTWLTFPNVGWWPFGFVCVAPWLVCVCTAARAPFLYLLSYLFGVCFFLLHFRWMFLVTKEGYFAMACYAGVYFPLVAWPIRHMYRRYGFSVALTAPIAWVAFEYLRSTLLTGFPMMLLAHSLYEATTMIQISDLVGAYGVSFIIVMVNGLVADLLIQPIIFWRSDQMVRLPLGTLATIAAFLGTLIYGSSQTSQKYFSSGPRVAVVQHDVPMLLDAREGSELSSQTVFNAHLSLARKAAAQNPKPDLIVLPETAMQCYVNEDFLKATTDELEDICRLRMGKGYDVGNLKYYQRFSRQVRTAFQKLSDESGVPILLGASSMEYKPTEIPPHVDAYNSAFLLEPNHELPIARYDKVHLVIFGEYVPFRYSFNWLYTWLNSLMPWGASGGHYSLTPGAGFLAIEIKPASLPGKTFRVGTPICFEEIMPYVARGFAAADPSNRKNIDLLLSVSNDGWFFHSSELEQHLASAVFRAVENRVSVARSVNTGESAVIYPNGKIHSKVTLSPEQRKSLDAVEKALQSLRKEAEKLPPLMGHAQELRAEVQTLASIIRGDLHQALTAAGPEFDFFSDRLTRIKQNLLSPPQYQKTFIDNFIAQIDDDVATLHRWKARPWMAPGIIVDEVKCDSRLTLYTRWGDWFSRGLVGLTAIMVLDWFVKRLSRRRKDRSTTEGVTDDRPG